MRWTLGLAWLAMGCNQLIGVHEYSADAASDSCTACECAIDTDCTDMHAACDHGQCACSAGYALGPDGCVWVGVIDDPGFERSPDRWTVANGQSTLTPSAPQSAGMQDPGYLAFGEDAMCHFGAITQALTMPKFTRSESLVVTTTYQADNSLVFYLGTYPQIGLANTWYETSYPPAGTAYTTARRMCLGAGQYAPESSTGVGAGIALNASVRDFPGLSSCSTRGALETFTYDHIEILPAAPGECPLPGQVTNGDVESGSTGWTLTGDTTIEPCATGHCVALNQRFPCGTDTATIQLSVPVATQNTSAQLTIDHTAVNASLADLSMVLDTVQSMQVGTGQTDSYCLPAHTRGGVFPLVAIAAPSGGGGNKCLGGAIYLDNVTLTNAVACGANPNLADPSFESGFPQIGVYTSGGTVTNESDPPGAYPGGTHDLHLSVPAACGVSVTWRALPTVPSGFGKPALKYHYKWPNKNMGMFVTSPATAGGTGGNAAWTEGEICLDPKLAGRMQIVQFSLSQPTPTTCPTTAESVYIDELSLVDEPNC